MIGVEYDFVVTDSRAACRFYEEIFGPLMETLQVTNYDQGLNEAIFNLLGARFHLLDENAEYGLKAPAEGSSQSVWINLMVEDLTAIWDRAVAKGSREVQPVTAIQEMGIMNASFLDPFGHVWLLHQIIDEAKAGDSAAHQAYLDEKFGPAGTPEAE